MWKIKCKRCKFSAARTATKRVKMFTFSCVVKLIKLVSVTFTWGCFHLLTSHNDSEKRSPTSAVERHPYGLLTGRSMCLINQRHSIGKQAPHQRIADTKIHLTSGHNKPYCCARSGADSFSWRLVQLSQQMRDITRKTCRADKRLLMLKLKCVTRFDLTSNTMCERLYTLLSI